MVTVDHALLTKHIPKFDHVIPPGVVGHHQKGVLETIVVSKDPGETIAHPDKLLSEQFMLAHEKRQRLVFLPGT